MQEGKERQDVHKRLGSDGSASSLPLLCRIQHVSDALNALLRQPKREENMSEHTESYDVDLLNVPPVIAEGGHDFRCSAKYAHK